MVRAAACFTYAPTTRIRARANAPISMPVTPRPKSTKSCATTSTTAFDAPISSVRRSARIAANDAVVAIAPLRVHTWTGLMWFQKKPKANPRTNIPAIMAPHNAPDATASTRSAFVAGVPAGVRSKQVTPPLSATNALRLVCKSGAPDEAAEGSVALSVARVPHRPGKWRRAVRRYYTWADLCAVGVRPGDLHVPKLRRSASAAGSDQGSRGD